MIPVKSNNPVELEKLCLLKLKIVEIERLFQMTKNDYRSLIILLFESDNFIKEITENVAFNYAITSQECMLLVSCENISLKVSKNSSSTQKLKSNECTSSLVYNKSPSKVSNNSENSSSTQKSESYECTSSLACYKSPSNVFNNLENSSPTQKSK